MELLYAVLELLGDILYDIVKNPIYIIALITTILAIYLWFKSMKRLVYSMSTTNIITDKQVEIEGLNFSFDNKRIRNLFISKLLVYNNGRKSINKDDLLKFKIKNINGHILKFTFLKEHPGCLITSDKNELDIKLSDFDKNDYFAIKVFHDSEIEIDGRISDTGKFLNTETSDWLKYNIIYVLIFSGTLMWSTSKFDENNITSYRWLIVVLIFLYGGWKLTRWLHSLFFIPDKISDKFD